MTTAIEIINRYDRQMPCISPQESVLAAAKLMNDYKVGALLVRDKEQCVGIFTEHDLLRRVVALHRDPADTPTSDVMSKRLVICPPNTSVTEARRLMAVAQCHNLPVVDADDKVLGLVTLGDLNAHEYEAQEVEADYLKQYLYGQHR